MTPHDPYDICACVQIRKTARLLTQRYDAALRPVGLKVTQFSILRTLSRSPGTPLTALAGILALDRTGLTRNLKPLERDGLISMVSGDDSRQRIAALTDHGYDILRQAESLWQDVQKRVIDNVGTSRMGDIRDGLAELNRAAQN
jgi:DNA-binding MarR family transcriptional regulator